VQKWPGDTPTPFKKKRASKGIRTRSGEKVVPVFVEGHGHDAVSQVKGFLDAVAVVNVDVDVQNSGVVSGTHRETRS